ncbi:MAG: hypothetical protein ABR568_10690 [Pyrinomonadaceae bacterium]
MMRTLTSTRIVRFVLAPLLSLWIAGAGCIMGCEGMVAAAATVAISISKTHSAHHSEQKATIVASGHACSAGSAKNAIEAKSAVKQISKSETTLLTVYGSSSGMMKDCPLAASRAAIAAKIRNNEIAAAPQLAHSILPAENALERTTPLSTPPRLLNRGHTYLRCCVFLI